MNKCFFVLWISILVVVTIGCNKSEISQVKIEIPVQTLLNKKFLDSIQVSNDTTYEIGYQFRSSKPGRITKIGCFVPQNLPYRVSLWDNATQDILVSTTVQVTDSTKFTYKDIAPIKIEANRSYIITVNNYIFGTTKKYFVLYKKPSNQFNLPINIGTITILRNLYAFCNATTCFPTIQNGSFYLTGVPDFAIEYTE